MFRTQLALQALMAALVLTSLGLAACNAEPNPTGPVVMLEPEYAGSGPHGGPGTVALEILDVALSSEIMAYYTYLYAAEDFGSPFDRIRDAELRHVEAVQNLYVKRGLEAPALEEPDGVLTFGTRPLACQAGVATELEVVARYEELIPLFPTDVAKVFLQLQKVSEDNHLEAFLACS